MNGGECIDVGEYTRIDEWSVAVLLSTADYSSTTFINCNTNDQWCDWAKCFC